MRALVTAAEQHAHCGVWVDLVHLLLRAGADPSMPLLTADTPAVEIPGLPDLRDTTPFHLVAVQAFELGASSAVGAAPGAPPDAPPVYADIAR